MKTNIASNIKYFRKKSNLTQKELAAKLFVGRSLITNYENGYSTPDVYTLCKLAEIFDISLDDLVEWSKD